MRYPLVWKELRESRLALLIGVLWMIGPIEFWLNWKHILVPWPFQVVLVPAAMCASGICMLALGIARFACERHNGTWEFLKTQPVAPQRIAAMKWGVAMAMAVVFMAISSGLSWYPITHVETRLASFTLFHWICFHVSGALLFMSILLLTDTFDWGEWLGTRAIVTGLLLIPFFWTMHQDFNREWRWTFVYAGLAAAGTTFAVLFAPALSRESLLPQWRFGRAARLSHLSPTATWIWLQWRQMRYVVVMLLTPVPLFLAAITLPGLLQAGSAKERIDVVSGMLPIVSRVMPALLCIAAGMLGWILPIMEAQSKADPFRWALPMQRDRVQYMRLAFTLGLLILISVPMVVMAVVQVAAFGQGTWVSLLNGLVVQYSTAAAICVVMLVLSTFAAGPFLAPVSVLGSIYVAGQLLDTPAPNMAALAACAVAAVIGATLLLPVIDRRREI